MAEFEPKADPDSKPGAPRRLATLPEAAANFAATMAFVLLSLWIYTRDNNYVLNEFNMQIEFDVGAYAASIGVSDVLTGAAALYAVLLVPYYALQRGFVCDVRRLCLYLRQWTSTRLRPAFGFEERRAALTLLLKFYFVPLMLGYLFNNVFEVLRHWNAFAGEEPSVAYTIALHTSAYFLILAVLYLIDIAVFTVGYMVELPSRGSEIRSVDPTVLGWACCLVCYPPFNQIGFAFLSWQQVDPTDFATPLISAALAWISIAAIAIYAWASVALGLRASNLTYRGIISHGPYRWVRHPAYAMKNIAAWIVALPAVADSFTRSPPLCIWIVSCVLIWTGVYVLRAITEERHLSMMSDDYARYAAQVRYRFLPGVI